MHRIRTSCIVIASVVIVLISVIYLSDRSKDAAADDSGARDLASGQQPLGDDVSGAAKNDAGRPKVDLWLPENLTDDQLRKIMADYDALSRNFRGEELQAQKEAFINRSSRDRSVSDICRLMDHFSADLGEEMGQFGVIPAAAITIKQDDPVAASELVDWILKVENPTFKTEIIKGLGRYYSGNLDDPIPFYQKLDLKSEQDFFIAGYIGGILRSPSKSLIESLIKFSPESGSYPNVVEAIKTLPASYDLASLPEHLGSGQSHLANDVVGALIGKWAESSPLAAAQFVSQAESENVRDALGSMMDSSNPNLISLMKAWTSTPQKDETLTRLLQAPKLQSSQFAWDLGLQVGDTEKRDALLTSIFHKWEETDKQAAHAAWNGRR